MSPVRPVTVLLRSMERDPVQLLAPTSANGRFEFIDPPSGACRLAFFTESDERPFITPPFWV